MEKVTNEVCSEHKAPRKPYFTVRESLEQMMAIGCRIDRAISIGVTALILASASLVLSLICIVRLCN